MSHMGAIQQLMQISRQLELCKSDVSARDFKIAMLYQNITQQSIQITKYKVACQEKDNRIHELLDNIMALKQQMNEIQNTANEKVDEKAQKINILEDQLQQLQQKYDLDIKKLNKQIEVENQNFQALDKQTKESQKNTAAIFNQKENNMVQQIEQKNNEIIQLKSTSLTQIEDLGKLHANELVLKKQITTLIAHNKQKDEKIQQLQQQLIDATSEHNLDSPVFQMNQLRQHYENIINKWKSREQYLLQEQKQLKKELQKTQRALEQSVDQRNETEYQVKQLNRTIKHQEKSIEELNQKDSVKIVNRLLSQLSDQKVNLRNAEVENMRMNKDLNELKEVNNDRDLVKESRARADKAELESALLKKELKRVKTLNIQEQLARQVDKLASRLSHHQQKVLFKAAADGNIQWKDGFLSSKQKLRMPKQ